MISFSTKWLGGFEGECHTSYSPNSSHGGNYLDLLTETGSIEIGTSVITIWPVLSRVLQIHWDILGLVHFSVRIWLVFQHPANILFSCKYTYPEVPLYCFLQSMDFNTNQGLFWYKVLIPCFHKENFVLDVATSRFSSSFCLNNSWLLARIWGLAKAIDDRIRESVQLCSWT